MLAMYLLNVMTVKAKVARSRGGGRGATVREPLSIALEQIRAALSRQALVTARTAGAITIGRAGASRSCGRPTGTQ